MAPARSRRLSTVRLLAAAASLLGLLTLGVPSALTTPQRVPAGWWKGTVTVSSQWDEVLTADMGIRGTATVKMTRAAEASAEFEVEFVEEWWWLDVPENGDCGGQVRARYTTSWRGTSEMRAVVGQTAGGVYFLFEGRARPPQRGRDRPDCHSEYGEEDQAGEVPIWFSFTSSQPSGSVTHRGSGSGTLFPSHHEPRPGGVNRTTVTWNLELVPAPPGPPQRIAYEGGSLRPIEARRGTKVQLTLGDARLVDAAGTSLATGGPAGCDLIYLARGRGARPARVRVAGTWAAGRLRCTWRVPSRGPLARTIATKNVQLSVAPWVLRGGARYWARVTGDHTLYILLLSRR